MATKLPVARLFRHSNPLTLGWTVSGVIRLTSGYPVTLYNPDDTSLLGTFGNGVNNHLLDTPNDTPGCPLDLNNNPANGPAFNPACFSLPALGQLGNAPRRFFYGPGTEDFDMTLIKNVHTAGSRALQVRLEVFNVFNHATIRDPGFGERQHRQPHVRRHREGRTPAGNPARGQGTVFDGRHRHQERRFVVRGSLPTRGPA